MRRKPTRNPNRADYLFKIYYLIVGPNDDVIIPKNSKKTDWEVELAVVIGKKASYVDETEAIKLCGRLLFTQ